MRTSNSLHLPTCALACATPRKGRLSVADTSWQDAAVGRVVVGAKHKTGDGTDDRSGTSRTRSPASAVSYIYPSDHDHRSLSLPPPPPRTASTPLNSTLYIPQHADSACSAHPGSLVCRLDAFCAPGLLTECSRTPADVEYPQPLRPTMQGRGVTTVPVSSVQVAKPTSTVESAKRLAAWTAVDKHVTKECQVSPHSTLSSIYTVLECGLGLNIRILCL